VTQQASVVYAVVKVGGGLLGRGDAFERVAGALAACGGGRPFLVVPGGGPFAEVVRERSHDLQIAADTAHWMAILGMDQYAHALASRIRGAALVERHRDIPMALAAGRIPVLAPYQWLRVADPLPHSWDVTSDSIAAWLAGALGAARLILLKPVAGDPVTLSDPYFARALPPGVECQVVAPEDLTALDRALRDGRSDER
jgi:dihydroneopterin aldolase